MIILHMCALWCCSLTQGGKVAPNILFLLSGQMTHSCALTPSQEEQTGQAFHFTWWLIVCVQEFYCCYLTEPEVPFQLKFVFPLAPPLFVPDIPWRINAVSFDSLCFYNHSWHVIYPHCLCYMLKDIIKSLYSQKVIHCHMSAMNKCVKAEAPSRSSVVLWCRSFWLPQTTISSGPAETCTYRTGADDFIAKPVSSGGVSHRTLCSTRVKHGGFVLEFSPLILQRRDWSNVTVSSVIIWCWWWCFCGWLCN